MIFYHIFISPNKLVFIRYSGYFGSDLLTDIVDQNTISDCYRRFTLTII